MPQLDFSTFPPQLIWLAITFVLLYVLMSRLALPKVGGIIAARRNKIDGDLEKAGAMKAEAEAVIAAYERALAAARQSAQATLKETTDKLAAAAAERQKVLTDKLAAETAVAEKRIADAKSAALADLKSVAAEVARSAVGKLTGETIDPSRVAVAIDRAVAERG
ncbi:MAG TPA: F0F1 ATP synthase subunit B' [Stellaceae bacterium]|nr:F0F1 ATP synthase subunit B' [Stellaceae bacterium]